MNRRHFLGKTAMTMAAAQVGMFTTEAADREPRELAAIGRAAVWLNSPQLTAATLRGKVVLVDFWTYTCINWLRTLPYRRAWAQKYREGLVVIGVHTPEFGFERNVDNVRRAVQEMRIEYPVVIDNDYSIWRAFRNHYWPALYFLDPRGRIRQHHFGEGEYEGSERAIQRLLSDAGIAGVGSELVTVNGSGVEAAPGWTDLRSPETYLGYERTANFVSRSAAVLDQGRQYAAPARLSLNQWALAGEWTMGRQAAVLNKPGGQIVCRFHARDLHLVMGPSRAGSPVRYRVTVDGKPPAAARGVDVDEGGNGKADDQRMYQLIRQPKPIVDRTFAIESRTRLPGQPRRQRKSDDNRHTIPSPEDRGSVARRDTLSPEQYKVLREHGTERAFTSPLNNEKRQGTFVCAGCRQLLFSSDTKSRAAPDGPVFTSRLKPPSAPASTGAGSR
jgi:thiol-disulfide isomerase/thioredoxin